MSKERMGATAPSNDRDEEYSLGKNTARAAAEESYTLDDQDNHGPVVEMGGEGEVNLTEKEVRQNDRNASPEVQSLLAGSQEIRKILASKMKPEEQKRAFEAAYARLLVAKREKLMEAGVDISDLLETPEGLSQLRREQGEQMVKDSARKVAGALSGVMGGIYEGVSYIPEVIRGGMNFANKVGRAMKNIFTLDNGYKAIGGAAAVGLTVSFPAIVLPVMGAGAAALYGQQYFSNLWETRNNTDKDSDSALPGVNRAVEGTNNLIDGAKKWGAGLFRRFGQAAERLGNNIDSDRLDVRRAYDRCGEKLLANHVHEGKSSAEALADLQNELRLQKELDAYERRLQKELDAVDPRLMTSDQRATFGEEVGAMREQRQQEQEKLRDLQEFEAREGKNEKALSDLGERVALAEDLMLEIQENQKVGKDDEQLKEDFEELTGEAYSDDFNPDAWMMSELSKVVNGDPSTDDIAMVVAARMEKANEEGYPRLQKKYASKEMDDVARGLASSSGDNDAPEVTISGEEDIDASLAAA